PANLRVVIATRHEPASVWLQDPGWRPLVQVTPLHDLAPGEAGQYLEMRGIDTVSRKTLMHFASGRPLILALGADMAQQGYILEGPEDTGPLLDNLVARFTREASSPAQRQALDAAAIVREISPGLLAKMLAVEDAGELYEW